MKVLSLFDGIAGAKQALKELNIDCNYYASEIDNYAMQVAKANHSDIIHIGDVKSLFKYHHFNDGKHSQFYNINRGELDLLIGGSPCQDLSIAKKDRKELQGDRSSLFYEYVRILNEVKPKYFILENVASMSKASKQAITKELFNIDPIMINSALLTAQNRKRLYWVGKLVDGKYQQVKIEQPQDKKIYLKDIIEEGFVDRDKSYCIDANYYKGGNLKSYFEKGRRQLVFDRPFKIGYFNKGGQGYSMLLDDYVIRKLTPNECCKLQGFPNEYCNSVSKTQGYKGLGNSFTVPVIKHLIRTILKDEL